jgi:peptidoglycan hydrolase-like protein with peptidoglycan-binding domain
MKDDYLWDKTGEPDPEIQQLEEILGTLRYQPKPLEIPEGLPLPRRRNYFQWLAIAAALLVAILAGGIWLSTRSTVEAPQRQAGVTPTAPSPKVEEKSAVPAEPKTPERHPDSRREVVAVYRHRPKVATPVLSKHEREEAVMAKEQVMLALRLTTEKLSLVHRKTQNTNPASQIKNQHRVG